MSVLLKNKFVLFSFLYILFLLILVVMSYLGISFGRFSFDAQDQDMILRAPSLEHPLGTDQLGRDLLARLIYGARLSLLVAVVTALIAFFIGVFLGTVSSMSGGKTDFFITRVIDIVYSLPDLLILIVVYFLSFFPTNSFSLAYYLKAFSWRMMNA